jgi:hypothetical protein
MMELQVMGYDDKEGKERQDSKKNIYHIVVPNKHILVDGLQYMNTLEN